MLTGKLPAFPRIEAGTSADKYDHLIEFPLVGERYGLRAAHGAGLKSKIRPRRPWSERRKKIWAPSDERMGGKRPKLDGWPGTEKDPIVLVLGFLGTRLAGSSHKGLNFLRIPARSSSLS